MDAWTCGIKLGRGQWPDLIASRYSRRTSCRSGLGVAMGIRPYIDDDIAGARLIAPFALSVPKGESWYLVYKKSRTAEPGFSAFRAWIVAVARA